MNGQPAPLNRTAEDQVNAIEALICHATMASPLDRLASYQSIINAQLSMNLMLLNRIRSLEKSIEFLNELALRPPQRKGINPKE